MKSKFDAMKVFSTFIFVAKNKLGAQLLFSPWKINWGEAPAYLFHGKIKVRRPTYFHRENKSCKDLHGIPFVLFLNIKVGV